MLGKPQIPSEPGWNRVLRWPTPRSRDWTERLLRSASSDPNILTVVAIGSAVRPCVTSTDIDLIIVCGDPDALEQSPPLEVDLRAYPAAGIDAQIGSGHDVLGWAVRYGRVLYQRDCFWDAIFGYWKDRIPLPSSKLARDRATAAHRHLSNVVQFGDVDAAYEQALCYLTHLARAELLDSGVFPASRPELPEQLRSVDKFRLAEQLDRLLHAESPELPEFDELLKSAV